MHELFLEKWWNRTECIALDAPVKTGMSNKLIIECRSDKTPRSFCKVSYRFWLWENNARHCWESLRPRRCGGRACALSPDQSAGSVTQLAAPAESNLIKKADQRWLGKRWFEILRYDWIHMSYPTTEFGNKQHATPRSKNSHDPDCPFHFMSHETSPGDLLRSAKVHVLQSSLQISIWLAEIIDRGVAIRLSRVPETTW